MVKVRVLEKAAFLMLWRAKEPGLQRRKSTKFSLYLKLIKRLTFFSLDLSSHLVKTNRKKMHRNTFIKCNLLAYKIIIHEERSGKADEMPFLAIYENII